MKFDRLELELRRLPGVCYVAFGDVGTSTIVQIMSVPTTDLNRLRWEAERLCSTHLDGRFVLELGGSARPSRIRLLQAEVPSPSEVIVHLGYDGICTMGRSEGADPPAAAAATFQALQKLGASVPFRVEAAAVFEHHVGEGVMLVLGSDEAGQRYGVAGGSDQAQATARATLHALNRYLSTQPFLAAAAG